MPRACSAGERTAIGAAHNAHYLWVEIADADGTLKDVTALAGTDWVTSLVWGEDPDRPVATGTLTLRRDTDDESLAPLIGASLLNRNGAGAYAPLLEKGRLLVISSAVMAFGVAPTEADKHEEFRGRLDRIEWHDEDVVVEFSDEGAWIADAWIRNEGQCYTNAPGVSTTTGILLGQVLQNMLNDAIIFGGPPALYEPVPCPFIPISTDPEERRSLLEAMRDHASKIGWELRYRYDASDVSRLTLYEPDRTDVTPDWTLGPNEYRDVTNLETSIADIRNVIRVTYLDSNGARQTVTVSDAASIAKYGERFMELDEDASSTIRTETDATALANAALSDLREAPADQEIETLYFRPVQLGDIIQFLANGDHYDSDQVFACVAYEHRFEGGEGVTTIRTRGKPIGQYKTWLRHAKTSDVITQDTEAELHDVRKVGETLTQVTYSITPGAKVAEVWVYNRLRAVPIAADPWPSGSDSPDQILTAAGAPLTITVDKPAEGEVRLLQLEPRLESLDVGPIHRLELLHNDAFGIDPVPSETAGGTGTGTLTVTVRDPGGIIDPTARIKFYVTDGAGVRTLELPDTAPAPGVTTGVYSITRDKDPRRAIMIEILITYADGVTELRGRYPFDVDQIANVMTASVSLNDDQATVSVLFDTDTEIGATGAEYRVDGGAWADLAVAADLTASFVLTALPDAEQAVEVRGKNAANVAGPTAPVKIPRLASGLRMNGTAQQFSSDANEIVERVTASDPINQGAGTYITITPDASGCTVTPSTPQAVADGGHVDFTITRPDIGEPPGRVVFYTSAAGRLTDSDACEVQSKDAGVTFGSVTVERTDDTHITVTAAPTGLPSDAVVNIPWSIDGVGSGNSDGHTLTQLASGILITVPTMGATPSGSVEVDIDVNGVLYAMKKKNGAFAL